MYVYVGTQHIYLDIYVKYPPFHRQVKKSPTEMFYGAGTAAYW